MNAAGMRSRDALLVAYAAAAIAHLGALAAGVDPLAVATKVVLVPLLLGWVLLAGRPAPRLLVVALVLAGVGALAAGVSVRGGWAGCSSSSPTR